MGTTSRRACSSGASSSRSQALLDGSDIIDLPHLMTGDPIVDRILEALRAAPNRTLTRTDTNDLFAGNKGTRQIQAALDLLFRELRLVRSGKVKTAGRPAEIWQLL